MSKGQRAAFYPVGCQAVAVVIASGEDSAQPGIDGDRAVLLNVAVDVAVVPAFFVLLVASVVEHAVEDIVAIGRRACQLAGFDYEVVAVLIAFQ